MTCSKCQDVVERTDVPHVVRACEGCGRELHVAEPGEHGRGIKVQKGERFVIPGPWLNLSPNPLKGRGQFSRSGISFFAKQIFLQDLVRKADTFSEELETLEKQADDRLSASTLIEPLDINNPDDVEPISEIIKQHADSEEFWAFWMGQFCAGARQAREAGNLEQGCWAIACAERCRTMLLFKEHLEEVVWMGNSARRILDALAIWEGNKDQGDEQFWQLTFNDHSYVLSQVFAVPVVFIGERAYVGGMGVDRQAAKFVDYLFSAESSRESLLVEIKTPVTRLLGARYRKTVYRPSAELTGAVVQVLSYRAELISSIQKLTAAVPGSLEAFRPRCVLVIGDAARQLDEPGKRTCFELFRSSCEVEIITYDELFRKVEILAELFGLKKKGSA